MTPTRSPRYPCCVGTILIGTCGFSYEEWRGPFYPKGLPRDHFLSFYAEHFAACEINFTYYRLPDVRTMASLLHKSQGKVEFVVKAPSLLTHERSEDAPTQARAFVEALQPLKDGNVLSGVLVQFPFSFHATKANREYVFRLRDLIPDIPLIVEFRNARWVSGETFELLKDARLAFCNVDEPRLEGLLPPLSVVTAPPGYVRFHGRNTAKWWQHKEASERYDYSYSEEELREWVPRLLTMSRRAPRTYAFFNNHPRAQAVDSARLLTQLLGITEKSPQGAPRV